MAPRNLAAVALVTTLIAGCTSWQTVRPVSSGDGGTAFQGEVRVTRVDGGSYVLRDVRIANDSVIGTNAAGGRIAVATGDVSTIEQRRVDAGRTAGLVGGTAVTVWLVALAVTVLALAIVF